MTDHIKTQVEQIIRTNSLYCNQEGYDQCVNTIGSRKIVMPSEYIKIWKGLDWCSQDGYEGN